MPNGARLWVYNFILTEKVEEATGILFSKILRTVSCHFQKFWLLSNLYSLRSFHFAFANRVILIRSFRHVIDSVNRYGYVLYITMIKLICVVTFCHSQIDFFCLIKLICVVTF